MSKVAPDALDPNMAPEGQRRGEASGVPTLGSISAMSSSRSYRALREATRFHLEICASWPSLNADASQVHPWSFFHSSDSHLKVAELVASLELM
jgi:hypothetical protein